MLGMLVQIRPSMGFDLLLPLFAAAILGGIGSVPGAVAGAMVVGVGEAATVQIFGAEWRAAVAFLHSCGGAFDPADRTVREEGMKRQILPA